MHHKHSGMSKPNALALVHTWRLHIFITKHRTCIRATERLCAFTSLSLAMLATRVYFARR